MDYDSGDSGGDSDGYSSDDTGGSVIQWDEYGTRSFQPIADNSDCYENKAALANALKSVNLRESSITGAVSEMFMMYRYQGEQAPSKGVVLQSLNTSVTVLFD